MQSIGKMLWREPLVRFFASRPDMPAVVIDRAVQMLRFCGFVQPFLALLMILPFCLKSAGDTRYPMLITFCGVLGLRLPGCYLAARFLPFGVLGVWVVMMSAMMFPSLAPTVALYARMTRQRGPSRPLLFTSGYGAANNINPTTKR